MRRSRKVSEIRIWFLQRPPSWRTSQDLDVWQSVELVNTHNNHTVLRSSSLFFCSVLLLSSAVISASSYFLCTPSPNGTSVWRTLFSVAPPTLCGHRCLQSLMQTTRKTTEKKKVFYTHSRRVFQSRANCTVWSREAERWGGDCIPSRLQLEQIQMSVWRQVKQSIFVYITVRVPSAVAWSLWTSPFRESHRHKDYISHNNH